MSDTTTSFEKIIDKHRQAHIETSLLFFLQYNQFIDAQKKLFSHTHLKSADSYYYCLTGLSKDIYHVKFGIDGLDYSAFYYRHIRPCLLSLFQTHQI